MLLNQLKNNKNVYYRPCIKIGNTKWEKYNKSELYVNNNNEVCCKFDLLVDFDNTVQILKVAYCYPYSNMRIVNKLKIYYSNFLNNIYNSSLYFNKRIFAYSYNGEPVYLLTITNFINKSDYQYKDENGTDFISKNKYLNKPIIILSGRIHPGETPASFALEESIKYLLSLNKTVQQLLNKFIFLIIPNLNPDGVIKGNFRYDALNQNLNRYYKETCSKKQPQIFEFKKLVKNISVTHKIFMYCDYHSHGSLRNNFIYLNNMEYTKQVQANLFCKLFENIDNNFSYNHCIFSKKQMKAKDRNDKHSKEGSARVFFYQKLSIVLSFTLELGYHCNVNSANNSYYSKKDYKEIGINFLNTINEFSMWKSNNNKINRELVAGNIYNMYKKDDNLIKDKIKNIANYSESFFLKYFKKENNIKFKTITNKVAINKQKVHNTYNKNQREKESNKIIITRIPNIEKLSKSDSGKKINITNNVVNINFNNNNGNKIDLSEEIYNTKHEIRIKNNSKQIKNENFILNQKCKTSNSIKNMKKYNHKYITKLEKNKNESYYNYNMRCNKKINNIILNKNNNINFYLLSNTKIRDNVKVISSCFDKNRVIYLPKNFKFF